MPPSKTRFITACQQMLALAVVLAALTPAASVVTLDVVREVPGSHGTRTEVVGDLAAYVRASARTSKVPTQVVDAKVQEYPLTAPATSLSSARGKSASLAAATTSLARTKPGTLPGSTELLSRPQPVTGYGTIGVTWAHGVQVPEDEISFDVRWLDHGVWSDWLAMSYHDDHGPDAGSAEARHARPGTDELIVGDVDQVQVRSTSTDGIVPADMQLAVIDPGEEPATAVEKPAIDTNTMDGSTVPAEAAPATPADADTDATTTTGEATDGSLALQAATYTPKPVIYSRAQWGADERMRDKSSLHYFEVHAGFVHHTVNANDYTRAEVPGILRSIYAYHTQSKGWSDIGYNFLVDRFGRIWEGRYGGVDRPVVGAHTLNYNDYSFAMSAIGNYDIHQPSAAMIQAYGALFAWKLSLHGVDASSTKQWVGTKDFQAINGHRDAGQTACPGRYLYAKIPKIRQLAAEAQRGWAGRELESNLASTPHPDLVVRRPSDGHALVIPTGGLTQFTDPVTVAAPWTAADTAVVSPDLTGDGFSDVVVQVAGGAAQVYPGDGVGGLGSPIKKTDDFDGHDLLTAVGDLNGDGRNDLVARRTANGRLDLFAGTGNGGFQRKVLDADTDWNGYNLLVATGDVNGDGKADLMARTPGGSLVLRPGTGSVALGPAVTVSGGWGKFDTVAGYGDFTSDGVADLVVRRAGKPAFLRPGRGDGTFGHQLGPIDRLSGVTAITGGNLTGTAASDVLARKGGSLVLVPNAGTFETGTPIDSGISVRNADLLLNAGDWDRDGFGDIITRKATNGSLFVRRGDGTGHFSKALRIGTGFGGVSLLAAVGDMTGDGLPDLMGQPAGGAIRIYPGNGLAGLSTSYVAHERIKAGEQIPVGRWDGDGAPDTLFRSGNALTLFPGNGPGGLTSPRSLSLDLSPYDWVIGVSDVDLTGRPDLLVRATKTGYLWLLKATATGFEPRRFLGEGMNAYDLAG
ncbi:VCBS repeat-containing protein [Nocardioides sp. KIGAM211]|uniref:VCBS repeat-containing protein n=1 Tax=Nocardioides luti TaxID=2761101 RepID=A0A7X0VC12_9ACTN|nr:FG-GAP-like repeat-containing protein [Nocardioides luti]MBB6628995.1 VCBS repeat-containing protein [Nocardioides luti]